MRIILALADGATYREIAENLGTTVWSMAINIARREGVGRTAQELHLDGGKLEIHLVARRSRAAKALEATRRSC